jgi:hypothetical protein
MFAFALHLARPAQAHAQFPKPFSCANDESADEVRRSGRANKGHHTKNADALDEAISKAKPKSKPEKKSQAHQQAQPEPARSQSGDNQQNEEDEEEDAIYRCVCGDQREIRGREMIMCDKCEAWQHNKCLNLPDSSYWENKTYLCEQCKPEDHQELLAAMARGEKPWNRKKGSKAAKPKFRHSDVGSEATSEKKDTPTPQPTQSHPPTPVSHAAPTVATAQETKPDAALARNETKVSTKTRFGYLANRQFQSTKKATPKSQPQSPLGEKRPHDAIAERDAPSAKRRKSSAQSVSSRSPRATGFGIDALPEKQRKIVEALAKTLASTINQVADSGRYRIPDGDTPSSVAMRLALQIDHEAIVRLGPPTDHSSPYAQQFRTLVYNTKKNAVLVDRLLNGSLTPGELAVMPAEEMASEDKQREFAAMKEASERQIILTEQETGPRLRKTHKGEEIVGEDDYVAEPEFKPPELKQRESADETKSEQQLSPREDGGAVVELPEAVTQNTSLTPEISGAQKQSEESGRRASAKFDINSVFDKVKSPQHDQQTFHHRRQNSIKPHQTPQVVDADIDRLLKDEDNDVEMGGTFGDPSIIWKGNIEMQVHGSFEAVARFIAGGDFGQVIPWEKLLAPKLPILGRIEAQRGNDYIQSLASQSNLDVSVLSVSAVTAEGQALFDRFYNYFYPRNRWGVVPVDQLPNDAMRDLYVIPVEPGGSELPGFLNLLEYCTIETPRPTPMLLLALVAKLPVPEPTPQHPQPQHSDRSSVSGPATSQAVPAAIATNIGPSPSPLANPHGPQYSPMQGGFSPVVPINTTNGGQHGGQPVPTPQAPQPGHQPPNGHVGQHPQHSPNGQNGYNGYSSAMPQPPPQYQNPRAREIFGPFIDAPVLTVLFSQVPNMDERLMLNAKDILERFPAARTDIHVFGQKTSEGGRQASGQAPQPPNGQTH